MNFCQQCGGYGHESMTGGCPYDSYRIFPAPGAHTVTIIEDSLHEKVAALEERVEKMEDVVKLLAHEAGLLYGAPAENTEAAVREQSTRSKGVKGRPQDGAREGYHLDSGQQDPLAAATSEGCNIIAGGLAPGEPCPEGCDICADDDQPAVATQSKPPRPTVCGECICDYDFGLTSPIRFCTNDPHYYAPCCGWSCGEHKCRHARCVDDGTAPEGEDDE